MNWLRSLLKSAYTRLLEELCAELKAENARLRAENRALTSSLLGTAGLPPLPEQQEKLPALPPRRRSLHQIQAKTERKSYRKIRERQTRDGEVRREAEGAPGSGGTA